jgi:tetratricopeptide (TPR) repeat protein
MTDDLYERYKEALRTGHVAVLRGTLDEAVAAYQIAAEIAPSRALPHTSLGGVFLRLGHLENALTEFSDAVARAPHDEGALLGQAEALTAAGMHSDAASALDHVAEIQEASGRLPEAADTLRRAIELEESIERTRRQRSLLREIRLAAGDHAAERLLARALRLREEPAGELQKPARATRSGRTGSRSAGRESTEADAEPSEAEAGQLETEVASEPEPVPEVQAALEPGPEVEGEAVAGPEAPAEARGQTAEVAPEAHFEGSPTAPGEAGRFAEPEQAAGAEPVARTEPEATAEGGEMKTAAGAGPELAPGEGVEAELEAAASEAVDESAEALPVVGVMEGADGEGVLNLAAAASVTDGEHQPTGDELLAAAEAADQAGDNDALRSLLIWTARAYAQEGRFEAGLDAAHRLLLRCPADVDAHLVLVELYAARSWDNMAVEKLKLLDRLAELSGDEETHQRLCALAGRVFPDDPGLAQICS